MQQEIVTNFENKIHSLLNYEFATKPIAYGYFHLSYLIATICIAIALIAIFRKPTKKQVKWIYFAFYIVLFTIELFKQLLGTGQHFKSYVHHQEYIPLMLCSMPLYIILIYLLVPLKYEKTNNVFLSYLTIFNLWTGLFVMLYPGDVFIKNIFICHHTMIYHGILLILGLWGTIRTIVKFNFETIMWAGVIFITLMGLIAIGNEILYQLHKANKLIDPHTKSEFYPNLFNMSHRRLSPFISGIAFLKKSPYWLITLAYIPVTIIFSSLIYALFSGIGIGISKLENKIALAIKNKKQANQNQELKQNS